MGAPIDTTKSATSARSLAGWPNGGKKMSALKLGLEVWVVRKDTDMRKLEPEICAVFSKHRDKQCLFCREDRELGATVAYRWLRHPEWTTKTAAICAKCVDDDDQQLGNRLKGWLIPGPVPDAYDVYQFFCGECPDSHLVFFVDVGRPIATSIMSARLAETLAKAIRARD